MKNFIKHLNIISLMLSHFHNLRFPLLTFFNPSLTKIFLVWRWRDKLKIFSAHINEGLTSLLTVISPKNVQSFVKEIKKNRKNAQFFRHVFACNVEYILFPVYIFEALESLFQNIPNLYSSDYNYRINSWFLVSIPKTAVYSKTKEKLTFIQKTYWNRVCFVVLSLRLKFYENLTRRSKVILKKLNLYHFW